MLLPQQLLRRQQSCNSRLALSEHPQETWHRKREALEEERIVGDQDEKTKYSYNEVLTTATACFSHSLMHLTKELTPHFANLLRSSEDSWTRVAGKTPDNASPLNPVAIQLQNCSIHLYFFFKKEKSVTEIFPISKKNHNKNDLGINPNNN